MMDALIELAISIGVEGWEGRPVGALFVVGDSSTVMEKSRQLTLNPFQGYSEDEKNIMNPDVRHALHAFAVLDGAFIVREDGVVVAAGRYLNFDEGKDVDVPLGLGARHMAAAGISRDTERDRDRGLPDLGLGARLPPRQVGPGTGPPRPAKLGGGTRIPAICWFAGFRDTIAPLRMRLTSLLVRAGSLALLLSLFAGPAAADDPRRAKELFQEGTTFFDVGQFDKAIEAWQAGYKAKPDPGFLYNIAQAYRISGDPHKAIFFYRGYLRNSPNAENRVEVEQKIATLQKQAAELDKNKQPALAIPAPPPAPGRAAVTPPPPAPAAVRRR